MRMYSVGFRQFSRMNKGASVGVQKSHDETPYPVCYGAFLHAKSQIEFLNGYNNVSLLKIDKPLARSSYICKVGNDDVEIYLCFRKKTRMYELRCFDHKINKSHEIFHKKTVAKPIFKTLEEAKKSMMRILGTDYISGLSDLQHKKPIAKKPIRNRSIKTLSGGGGPGTGKRR